jgi:hypothetical protein
MAEEEADEPGLEEDLRFSFLRAVEQSV